MTPCSCTSGRASGISSSRRGMLPTTLSASQSIWMMASGLMVPVSWITLPPWASKRSENTEKLLLQMVRRSKVTSRWVPSGKLREHSTSTTPEDMPHQ